jgi:hypothetical protein
MDVWISDHLPVPFCPDPHPLSDRAEQSGFQFCEYFDIHRFPGASGGDLAHDQKPQISGLDILSYI